MPKRDRFASPYGKPAAPVEAVMRIIEPPQEPKTFRSAAGNFWIMDELFEMDRPDRAIHSMAGKMAQHYERRRKEELLVDRYGDAW